MEYARFETYGFSHITALAATALFTVIIIAAGRKIEWKYTGVTISFMLILIILTGMGLKLGVNWLSGKFRIPMQLCDWAAILMIYVLIVPDRRFFEPAYFWGMGGTLQALITPDVRLDFPDVRFFSFFLLHCGVVAGIFYSLFVQKLSLGRGAVKRVFIFSQIYILSALTVNYVTGANYGYLSRKPSGASILDFFGPWPYYIAGMEIAGLLICLILYIPFAFKNRKATESG